MNEDRVQNLANLPAKSPQFLAELRRATVEELNEAFKLRRGVPGERPERRKIALRLQRLHLKKRRGKHG
jgi:hypothetical protein